MDILDTLRHLAQQPIFEDEKERGEQLAKATSLAETLGGDDEDGQRLLRQMTLQDRLLTLNAAYYSGSAPLVEDAEWDELYEELLALEEQTAIQPEGSPTRRVGSAPEGNFPTVVHRERLWSMDKTKSKEGIRDWVARIEKRRQEHIAITH